MPVRTSVGVFKRREPIHFSLLFAARFAYLHVVLDLAVARPTVTPVGLRERNTGSRGDGPKHASPGGRKFRSQVKGSQLDIIVRLACSPSLVVVSIIAPWKWARGIAPSTSLASLIVQGADVLQHFRAAVDVDVRAAARSDRKPMSRVTGGC
ncbi:hypothetical protein IWX90DRAFT_173114 [Phyllosticta citrichinensis]|uniref:Uncharacterized protein n=1 Tax=Phyllosticta citrichinensis TaxID=1130410 RepID=A0ABR1XV54_9PEZI